MLSIARQDVRLLERTNVRLAIRPGLVRTTRSAVVQSSPGPQASWPRRAWPVHRR
jgi:hypothetical protein